MGKDIFFVLISCIIKRVQEYIYTCIIEFKQYPIQVELVPEGKTRVSSMYSIKSRLSLQLASMCIFFTMKKISIHKKSHSGICIIVNYIEAFNRR